MRWVLAVAIGVAVFSVAMWQPRGALTDRLAPFLDRNRSAEDARPATRMHLTVHAGVAWALLGGFIGLLVAQGDLFVGGPGRSVVGFAAAGAGLGYLGWRIRASSVKRTKDRRFRLELPVVTDALTMQIVSGESVGTAIQHVASASTGEVTASFERVLARTASGASVPASLLEEARNVPHQDGRRLLETLAHAHTHGGRLGDSLADLSTDFRAGIERDLTSEGGKRAVAAHGPVLALMVPTALLFLLYPTVVGLRALSGSP